VVKDKGTNRKLPDGHERSLYALGSGVPGQSGAAGFVMAWGGKIQTAPVRCRLMYCFGL